MGKKVQLGWLLNYSYSHDVYCNLSVFSLLRDKDFISRKAREVWTHW